MTDIRQTLLAAFGIEHREHLAAIRNALGAAGSGRPFDLKDAFRRAHSLKGAARAVNLPVVEDLAHRLEALFSAMERGEIAPDRRAVAAVERGLDAIEGYVAALAETPEPLMPEEARQALDALLHAGTPPASERRPVPGGAPEAAETADPNVAAAPAPVEYLRVAAEQVDKLSASVHELLAELQVMEGFTDAVRRIEADLRDLGRHWERLGRHARLRPSTGRLPQGRGRATPRLEAQLADFGRDLGALTRKVSALSLAQRRAAWAVAQAAREVGEDAERISLVPAEAVFGGFGRMVRDLARAEGREADVRVSGLDIQADRRVLQALKDPVMHLLRNAVSHGAEPIGERFAAGKPPEVQIRLAFASDGGRLHLTVSDDGRGPDLDRIAAAAVRQGLLKKDGERQPEHLLSLVFEPGFSTAPVVDRLSGRGVGLSVVREAVRRLHGTVALRAREPWGTEASIAVPLIAARQVLLLVEAGEQVYGLPSQAVERLVHLRVEALESVEGRPTARLSLEGGDAVVPLVSLTALLGAPTSPIPEEGGRIRAVVLRRGERRCALAVDALCDVRTLLVTEAQAIGADPGLVSGGVLLEEETPALVLSPDDLIDRALRDDGRHAGGLDLPDGRSRPEAAPATILVVDDSITTRTLEKSILEAQGYRVLLSVDGLDALALLRSGEAVVDLVVADVEMPRMDGFGLLQAIKGDPRLAATPVILMTSRADPEDVRRGLDLGAGAYITKQKFDQRELLATIGQLL